jgi:hypothetical protein
MITITVLLLLTLCGTAHCLGPSQQTSQVVLSLYIKQCNPWLSVQTRTLIASEIITQCNAVNIPYEIIAAIVKIESYYDPNAVGPMGEIGLMQVYTMCCSGVDFNKPSLYDISYNITAGICIFCDKLRIAKGDMFKAIELYNGRGPKARKFRDRVIATILDIFRFRVANYENIIHRRILSTNNH